MDDDFQIEREIEEKEDDKMTTLHDYVRLLRENEVYRILFISYCIDNCGNWFTYVACISIIEHIGQSGALDTALFLISRLLPSVLFAGLLGPVADRYNKFTLLIVCSLGSALSVLLIVTLHPIAVLYGKIPALILIYTLTLVQFTFSALYEPVRNSLLPIVVSQQDLIVATSLDGIAWSTVGAFGATLGGFVNSWFGVNVSFGLDVVSYMMCACWLYSIPRRVRNEAVVTPDGRRNGLSRSEEEGEGRRTLSGGDVELMRTDTGRTHYASERSECYIEETSSAILQYHHGGDEVTDREGDGEEDGNKLLATEMNTDFITAVVYLYENKFILILCLIKAGGSIIWGVSDIISVKVSQMVEFQTLGDESITLGLIFSCVGIGCQLGPFMWNYCTPQKEKSLMFAVVVAFVQMGISYVLMVHSPSRWAILWMFASTVLRTMGSAVVWIYSTLLLQKIVKGCVQGRIFAIEQAVCVLCEIASVIMGGIFFDRFGWGIGNTCRVMGLVGGGVSLFWVVVYGLRYHSGWVWAGGGEAGGAGGGAYSVVAGEEEGEVSREDDDEEEEDDEDTLLL